MYDILWLICNYELKQNFRKKFRRSEKRPINRQVNAWHQLNTPSSPKPGTTQNTTFIHVYLVLRFQNRIEWTLASKEAKPSLLSVRQHIVFLTLALLTNYAKQGIDYLVCTHLHPCNQSSQRKQQEEGGDKGSTYSDSAASSTGLNNFFNSATRLSWASSYEP